MINHRSGCGGLGMGMHLVGLVLSVYIIVYGQMQAFTPQLVLAPLAQTPPNKYVECLWCIIMIIPPLYLGAATLVDPAFDRWDPETETLNPAS